MLLYEPPPTQADIHFRLFGIPIRVSPWFWVVALMFGVSGSVKADPVKTLMWVAVIFASILVHELGHALLMIYYGGHPRITLHGVGGLAICEDCNRSPWPQILISLAGPLAGFLLAAIVVLGIWVSGHFSGIQLSWLPVKWEPFEPSEPGKLPILEILIRMLLFANIFWGVLNLLPIYPLDGGRVSRELFTLGHPRRGIVASLWLSAVVSAVVAVFALREGLFIMTLMFGYLAYASYQTIRAYQQHWSGSP
jgi:stage IV sporulation protein FB